MVADEGQGGLLTNARQYGWKLMDRKGFQDLRRLVYHLFSQNFAFRKDLVGVLPNFRMLVVSLQFTI